MSDAVRGWVRLPNDEVRHVYVEARFNETYPQLRKRILAAAEEKFGVDSD